MGNDIGKHIGDIGDIGKHVISALLRYFLQASLNEEGPYYVV